MAVTSLDPLRAWVFPDGLTKLATQPFSADRNSLDNLFIHLTNPGVLTQDESADLTKYRLTHSDLRKRLRQEGHDDTVLFQEIQTVIAKSLLAVREPVLVLQRGNNYHADKLDTQFMLLGYDILIDADLRPWLIEVNGGPSIKTDSADTTMSSAERAIKDRVAIDALRLSGLLPPADILFEPLFTQSSAASF